MSLSLTESGTPLVELPVQAEEPTQMEVEEVPWYVADLYESSSGRIQGAVSKLKNTVIGSNRQKSRALRQGVLGQLLNLLSDPRMHIEIRRDAVITVGSLVKGTSDNVRSVVDAGAVEKLIPVLEHPDEKLVSFALSCLTTIFTYNFAPTELLFSSPNLISHLLQLMNQSLGNQISVATILSHSCKTQEHQEILASLDVIDSLSNLLTSTSSIRAQMPVINCLTSLAYKNESVARQIVDTKIPPTQTRTLADLLVGLIGRDKPVQMQINAAKCLTNLHRSDALCAKDPKILMKTLPCLVRLCGKEFETDIRIGAAETLAYLIEVDPELQNIASISNHLIPTLGDYIKTTSSTLHPYSLTKLFGSTGGLVSSGPTSTTNGNANTLNNVTNGSTMIQAAFLAFASLGANDEAIRKRIIETDCLMERLVSALDDPNEKVALASVRCLHSLSRSVHQLRTTFKDHAVWKPLMKLLQNHNNHKEMLRVASSTLCNLILEFSPAKEPLLDAGALEVLCQLTRHEDKNLRINGIWALMNVAFQADQRVKIQILSSLGTDQIFRLISDEHDVVMKTLGLLRNLLSSPHIDPIMSSYGKQIMQATILTLEGNHGPDVKEQALCMLGNIADGKTSKEFIMTNEDVLKKIANYIVHSNPKLQIAAILCVTNLCWKEEEGSNERQSKLKEMGVYKLLHNLITAGDHNLFDRSVGLVRFTLGDRYDVAIRSKLKITKLKVHGGGTGVGRSLHGDWGFFFKLHEILLLHEVDRIDTHINDEFCFPSGELCKYIS